MRNKAIGLLMIVIPVITWALTDDSIREEIRQRIAPVGAVNIAGDQPAGAEAAAPVAAPQPAAEKLSVGETTYKNHCVVCHAAGVAGAPKVHNAEDWAPRLKKGIDGLLASAIQGINAMPPKGTCVECSDADLKAAITFMSGK